MRKWLWGGAAVIGLLGTASLLWEPLAAEPAAPPAARSYDVEIVRDGFGVPHINGKSDADAAYGLAFAHSEDDFATIEEVVAMTRGRYGALAGQDGAQVDYVYHLLGVRDTVERRYAEIPADVRAVLDGYAAGLNHYAEKHPEEVRLPKLFPVNGKDIVAGFVLRAPFFYGLDNYIGRLVAGEAPPNESAAAMTPIGRDPEMNGSNAWAVAPSRMADGKTWLVSNSHQPLEGQVAWYEAVVHSGEGLDMAGALFPGSPFVLLGHNRHLGWTNTVNRPDLVDVYRLVLNEAGDKYRYDGQWLPLEETRVWLPVKFGWFTIPVPQTLYRSVHGPVIRNDQGAFAIRYAGIDNVKAVEQYYRNTKATNWDEWARSMSTGGITGTNFIYADKTGRIAYIYNALFPDRKPGFDYTKVLPGDRSAPLWKGPVPFDRFPKVVSPASGFVQNANNTPYLAAGPGSEIDPAGQSPYLGIELGMTNRGLMGTGLMMNDRSITPEELLAIKMDTRYTKSGWVKPWMDRLLAVDAKGDAKLAEAQRLLRGWDWSSDGKGRADALAERLIRHASRANWRNDPLPDPRETLQKTVEEFSERFGRLDPALGDIQRLRRGKVDLPLVGGADTLRATTMWDMDQTDGKMRVRHGDSFIMLVRWDKAGKVISESIQPYGAATNRPDSPHYTDQMKLYVAGKFKPVHFEWADAVRNAKRRYRP
ncbi:MAG: acylase [Sphingomonadales bacterium]|jgi:acyl-homoserine-lactone acylase|nr:acylase [Sphingomonadales bacterium]MBK9004646.1 acylase [Sphingomonadales bacterium]MBK9269828.1 acylase [Sphingomonadales bacterium]MBP6433664.1 acylase [Sphingorhabdus sp.]